MIKVTVANQVGARHNTVVEETTTTPKAVLEQFGVDLSRGMFHLDGASMQPGAMVKTFAELGYDGSDPQRNKCFLMQVSKTDNA